MTNKDLLESYPKKSQLKYILIALAAVIIFVLIVLLALDRVSNVYSLYFSHDQFKSLYYDKLGLGLSASEFLTVVTQFVYGVAWIPLTAYLVSWRLDARKLLMGFLGWVVVYGSAPLAMSLLGGDICFDQSSGAAQKWYVEDQVGTISMFDSGGFTSSGVTKKVITEQICRDYLRQQGGNRPKLLTANSDQIEFFDSVTGAPKVWYDKSADGRLQLFDKPGFDPSSGEQLHKITREIVNSLQKTTPLNATALKKIGNIDSGNSTAPMQLKDTSSSQSPSLWLHNGSTVYMVRDGSIRRLYYKQPRQGMLDVGATPNALLFDGIVSQEGVWRGSAYIFNRRCGKYPYAVEGLLNSKSGVITLSGATPHVDASCNVQSIGGSKNDTLIFTPN